MTYREAIQAALKNGDSRLALAVVGALRFRHKLNHKAIMNLVVNAGGDANEFDALTAGAE